MYTPQYPGPNLDLLEAQARVCTGPHQTRPLGKKSSDGPQPDAILKTILKSLEGELAETETVSEAQMGSFFVAMTLRKYFPEATQWSQAEKAAFQKYQPTLLPRLPKEIQFLMNPELGYVPTNPTEAIVVTALEKILRAKHLSYTETRQMCEAILTDDVKPALKGAALIGQRMNRETYEEVRGYLDAYFGPEQVRPIDVDSLTHFGQPYDGATRYFRPTLFVAAVRAALGEPSLLHSVDMMPPKNGVTEEAILQALGAKTDLSLEQTAALITNKSVGFGYISQREYSPGAYGIRELRVHIKKRPPWAATEKAQQVFKSPSANYLVIGYYHPGYEEPLLNLAWDRGFQAALAVRGEEGTSHCTLRLGKPSTEDYMAVNYSQGFRNTNGMREDFTLDVDPQTFGFDYERNPRMDSVSPETFAEAGLAALSGEKGHVYDRIVLNTAITDFLLGICPNADEALQRTKHAITSGLALAHLRAYIEKSKLV
jgi:anthranilate phosphoribosyltransferase